jgi:hypothetical protein
VFWLTTAALSAAAWSFLQAVRSNAVATTVATAAVKFFILVNKFLNVFLVMCLHIFLAGMRMKKQVQQRYYTCRGWEIASSVFSEPPNHQWNL